MREGAEGNRASVVVATCAKTSKPFGIRFEETSPDYWMATWAFAVKEAVGRREGYDRTNITGHFGLSHTYPGCPHCGAESYTFGDPVYCYHYEPSNAVVPASSNVEFPKMTLKSQRDR
jgi:hypothetical protein